MGKSGEQLEKVVKNWGKIGKSGKRWGKVRIMGKSAESGEKPLQIDTQIYLFLN